MELNFTKWGHLVSRLLFLANKIDKLNDKIGKFVSWFTLLMVLVQFTVVVMRYVFGLSSIFMQESIVYMHALVFLLAAGYTLGQDRHVRVDIFYGAATTKRKAQINLFGVLLFLWPVCILIFSVSWQFVVASWKVLEVSPEGSGIPGVFLLKTAILLYAALLFAQGFSLAVNSLFILTGSSRSLDGNNRGKEE